MPFMRPKLSDLRAQVSADITAGLPSADGLLRFSNLNILGTALAGLGHLNYGYLDWIAKQAVPYTASGEFLESWAALKKVYRKTATYATGQVTFPASDGAIIDAGTEVTRSDSVVFKVNATVIAGESGSAVVSVTAVVAGVAGNTPVGSLMTMGTSIDGVQSRGTVTGVITSGADQEKDDALFGRMLDAFQNTPKGGSGADYVAWAKAVPGVTRAWCAPNGFGAGSVVVYAMLDAANADYNGFPQGTNGVSSDDGRSTPANVATGDQLTIANSIFVDQPVTAMVYVCAPLASPIDFTITGLSNASTATRAAVAAAIADVLSEQGAPLNNGSIVELSTIDSAIASIAATAGFVVTSPTVNPINTLGNLPVLGAITYS